MSGVARSLRGRLAALCLCALTTPGGAAEVSAQGYRVSVYNPGTYARTRQTMSNRAALRAALKRRRLRAARRSKRAAARRAVN